MAGSHARFRMACLLLALLAAALLVILVSCPRKPAATGAPVAAPAAQQPAAEPPVTAPVEPSVGPAPGPPERAPVVGRLAIVIDDAGYDLAELEPFLRLPLELSVAVLPNLPHSAEAARRVRAAGKELLLHLPMEPDGSENPGPGALATGMSSEEIERLVEEALASVPGATGVSNHMGSKASADAELMGTVLAVLARRGLYYLDSRTTAETLGEAISRQLGVPAVERRVFLDAESGDGAIERSLEVALNEAVRDGQSVAIGHVQTPGLVAILAHAPEAMRAAGVKPAGVGELATGGEGPPAGLAQSPGDGGPGP